VTTGVTYCPRCGQKVSPSVGECLFCDPADMVAAVAAVPAAVSAPAVVLPPPPDPAEPAPRPASAGAGTVEAERAFGLLLFDAEESLARGHGDKALVLASRAVKFRPDSLTALALFERARREVLRGRRREKLEARIAEGRFLFEQRRFDEAERIVNSALKLLPDHPLAQYLHAQLKERRLTATTVEAEAERELDRLAHLQAQGAARAARAALANGWHRKALAAVRRGLRSCPDHPELLAALREVQASDDQIEREAARRRAVYRRVRAALDLLNQGQPEQSLTVLRAILREEPDDARAQAAVQEVRRQWLRRAQDEQAAPVIVPPSPVPAAPRGPAAPPVEAPDAMALRRLESARTVARDGHTLPAMDTRTQTLHGEIMLPRTRRRSTPLGLVLAGAVVALAAGYLLSRGGRTSAPAPPLLVASAPPVATARPLPPGPLDTVDAELRAAIETTLAAYARALEARDPAQLERVRPDLTAGQREALLAPFARAINVASDLRVLDVVPEGVLVAVPVLRTDVIVGGQEQSTSPVEEVLRFRRGPQGWVLHDGRR
jgi:tetratricopeptide (TPR) repeat protein